jgi:hypothetical protein
MIETLRIHQLHAETVERWHRQPIDNPYEGVWFVICQQHSFNFLLWHEEDVARSPDVSDRRIAEVKRAIDRYNQQRNDWIEKVDDWLAAYLAELRIAPPTGAPLNSETPGSVIDRLSILALRSYHLREQLERSDIDPAQRERVAAKLSICLTQQTDLGQSLAELLADIRGGRKRHRTYRQLKMYNDPTLNPYMYQSKSRRAS